MLVFNKYGTAERDKKGKCKIMHYMKCTTSMILFVLTMRENLLTCAEGRNFLGGSKAFVGYLPLLREFIPNAAEEIESDIHDYIPKQEDYVYDFYTVKDDMDMDDEGSLFPFPLVQVDDEDYYDGPDESDYESDDSNAENNPLNDYPDELSEESEERENSDNESEEPELIVLLMNLQNMRIQKVMVFPVVLTHYMMMSLMMIISVDDYDDGEDWRWSYL
ncbi:RNA-directed DNA methylation 4, putative isoform 4 [Quillaja saponaria]|uniref:RNA-directed DNA methylation 4, putative isoform 4 n=1 Tax=Quillaja saponaria TaxID=32244 RepID=A0AAD7LZ10_QUISA|nr:RNA-directed DNA methylation 4, putative isoform 4 [Quillaja saponaria]